MTSFFLDQHGCAKNQVDGELLIAALNKIGLKRVDDASDADIIVINSCGFIESAKKESLDSLMNARHCYPDAKIIFAGCLAERYANLFKTELPEADAIFGTGDISQIKDIVSSLEKNKRPVIVPEQKGVCFGNRNELLSFPGSTFVKITEGCNNRCSFCAIPIIRGALRSRPIESVVSEIRDLISRGIYEINLVGQDLAAYGNDFLPDNEKTCEKNSNDKTDTICIAPPNGEPTALPTLLQEISKIPGDFIIRLLYIHPDHFPKTLPAAVASDKRFLPYFDIPFQCGDDTIIRAMNRKGTSVQYIDLVKNIRETLPNAVIRTTFLTGFPGESDESFNNTVKFLEAIQPDWSGCFDYSKEDDTPAFSMKKQVPKKLAKARAARLTELQTAITESRLKRHVNQLYKVLIEELVEGNEGLAIGRAWFQAPEVDGAVVVRYDREDEKEASLVKPGQVVNVRIASTTGVDLDGVLCATETATLLT